jgi:hypothetical protein
MNKATLLSAMLLGSILLHPVAARADSDQKDGAVAAKTPAPPAGCVQGTGSRIPEKAGQCAGVGRSYSGEELKRTGQTSPGDALSMLDPAITVHK